MDPVYEEGSHRSDAVLEDRLNKVRSAVHRATQDAWKQASGYAPSAAKLQKENASFLLGMDLFGTGGGSDSTSSVSGLERTVREKLDEVERELGRLQLESSHLTGRRRDSEGMVTMHDDSDADHDDDDFVNEGSDEEGAHGQQLAGQIQGYKNKIAFLKQASLARACLEESKALASPALTTEPDLVQASQKLLEALRGVDEADGIILQDESSGQATGSGMHEVEVAHQIQSSLRHQIRKHRVDLVQKAYNVLDSSLEITADSIMIKSSEQLTTSFHVLETLHQSQKQGTIDGPVKSSALETALRNFTTRLYQEVLKPILLEKHSSRPWNVEETSDRRTASTVMIGLTSSAAKKGTLYRIQWSVVDGQGEGSNQSRNRECHLDAWKNILAVMQRILVFVQSKILLEREELSKIVGKKLFGKPNAMPSPLNLSALGLDSALLSENDQGVLMESMVDWLQDHCLQQKKNEKGIDDLPRISKMQEELIECTMPFCQEMVDRRLIPQDTPPKLLSFCQNFEKSYVDQRRCVLLNEARDILMLNDYHNTVVVGVEENTSPQDLKEAALIVFQLSRSSISDTAHRLMVLIRKTMDEAVAVADVSQDSVLSLLRPTLYRTAREMLSLFRSIIPASHGREVAHLPRTAAVLHNDAVFLAHHCLTLGLEYREKFPPVAEDDARGKLLKQTCIFVDMVPLFRELADTSLGDMLELQKHQLSEIVGSRITYFGRGLQSDESLHEWSEAETALAAGIYHLRHLAQAWRPILAPSVFLRSMGYLADVLFALYLSQVTTATDISPNACQFTCALFHKASTDIAGLLQTKDDVSKYASEWGHFEAVGKFMELNHVSEVEQALSSGVFRHVASQELARLVQARYGESPRKRALLNMLSSVV